MTRDRRPTGSLILARAGQRIGLDRGRGCVLMFGREQSLLLLYAPVSGPKDLKLSTWRKADSLCLGRTRIPNNSNASLPTLKESSKERGHFP